MRAAAARPLTPKPLLHPLPRQPLPRNRPQRDGSLPPAQVAAAKALGDYVAACYASPIVQGSGVNQTTFTLMPSAPVSMDRVVVREDQRQGQLIRAFTLSATLGDGSVVALTGAGSSVGNKFIQVFAPITVASLTLNITQFVAGAGAPGGPFVSDFSAYSCEGAGAAASEALGAAGFPQPPYVVAAERPPRPQRAEGRAQRGGGPRRLQRLR